MISMALNNKVYKYIKGFEDYISEANYNPIKVMGLFNYYEFDRSKLEEEKDEFTSFIKNNFCFFVNAIGDKIYIPYLSLSMSNGRDKTIWIELKSYENLVVLDKFFTLLVYYGFIVFNMYSYMDICNYFTMLIQQGYKLNMFLDGTEYVEGIKDYTEYICKNVLEILNFRLCDNNFELKK